MEGDIHLIGRQGELAVVEEVLDAGAGCLTIVGEPGIGKTRMAEAVRHRAAARGALALGGRAAEFEAHVPFGLVVEALDERVGALDAAARRRIGAGAELACLFPSAALPHLPRGGLDAERFRLHYAVRAVLEELGAERRVVLILDDLQWADAASLELVGHLVARPAAGTLLVLVYRPGHLPARLDAALLAGVGHGGVRVLEPRPLSEDEARELAGPGIDAATVRALHRDSGGNPFYLEQLARSVRAGTPAREPDDEPLPQRVAASITGELARVSHWSRRLLHAAAVAGDPFDPGLVAEMAPMPDEEALAAIDDLVARGLIRVTEDRVRFVFRHPIVRRSVYGAMPPSRRVDAHRRAAAALERRGARVEALAHHVERSAARGDVGAAALLARAGHAVATWAPAAAAHWFATALALLPPEHPHEPRVELMLARARALTSAGRFDASHDAFEEVLGFVPDDASAVRARVVGAVSRLEHWSGRYEDARGRLERALARLGPARSVEATRLRVELGYDHWMTGEAEPMLALARRAVADARTLGGGLHMRAAALGALGEGLDGNPAAARRLLDEAAGLAARLRDDELDEDVEGLSWLAIVQADLGTQEAALRTAQRALARLRATGQAFLFAPCVALQGQIETMLGRLDDAAEHAAAALESATLVGNQQHRMWALTNLSAAETWRGRHPAALAAGEEAAALARSGSSSFFAGHARAWYAIALLESGRPARARAELVARGPAGRLDSLAAGVLPRWAEALALAELALGDRDAAARALREAEEALAGLGFVRRAGQLLRGRAALLNARGDHRAGADHAFQAVEAFGRKGRLVDEASARALAGRCLAGAGDVPGALAELRTAHEQLAAFGAHGHRAAVARDLRRLEAGRIAGLGAPPASLTRREREVAGLVADGLTNREIAEVLVLAPKSVENHVTRILGKLEVGSRAALPAALGSAESAAGG